MPKVLKIKNVWKVKDEIQNYFSINEDARFVRRLDVVSLIFDGFDSDTFTYYLKWLIRKFKTRKKFVLVLDNASSHKSNKVTEFVEKHRKRLELLFLPPYSPELYPVERVWKNLRYRVTHNTFFENLTALENAVIEYLKEHAKPNKRLTSLCWISWIN